MMNQSYLIVVPPSALAGLGLYLVGGGRRCGVAERVSLELFAQEIWYRAPGLGIDQYRINSQASNSFVESPPTLFEK